MSKINFGGVEEVVVTKDEFSIEKAKQVLKDEVISV
ncbi:MAG: ketol-acid reductoisomerase, partial [Desulfobacteraceae bacterium]|nr:ketol-acid reductoisomerase [Desulfobacteraceae bacterium]